MKRCWIGGAALLLLLAAGLALSLYTGSFWEGLSRETARAAAQPQQEAVEISEQVHQRWLERRWLATVVCDHAAVNAIEENFRVLSADAENYREICLRLAAQLHALAQSQKLTLENIF